MTKNEFAAAVAGISAARVAELTGRSVGSIQAYLSGIRPVPYEVALFSEELKKAIKNIRIDENKFEGVQMKKVIDGKMYDTESATCLASLDDWRGNNDFRSLEEGLYRTKRGAYFIAGRGGALTHWAVYSGDGNSRSGGEGITTMTESEARRWMEEHGTAEEYIAAFGAPPEA